MYDREDISNFNVETVFTISRNEASSNSEAINSNRDTEFSTTESEEPDCVLSVLFLNNKLGAAYYKIADKQVDLITMLLIDVVIVAFEVVRTKRYQRM